MTSRPQPDVTDETSAELARLRNAIACELHAQLALRGETINLAEVTEVAYAVAIQLGKAFRIEWAPGQESDRDDDDPLSLDAAVFYGSAMPTEGNERYPIFDREWPYRS
ncbi:hypothetical protein [Planosporangium flavigriseum]|uniref:Uncharacterized protein n=1 Tax=Planosporangium flavigriseum TaxID=373681 RepID=A0A8J3LRN7_9ACTN|nr:hypothetical protein [Planosporangium flavigriseum]GIG72411.1 hypothetical protein Pfl04_08150 [Planosporangium flavigriseum]